VNEAKSHPGPRRQVHHWKPLWKEFRIVKYQCIRCTVKKTTKLRDPREFPTTIYTMPDGSEVHRAPPCQPHTQPNIEECVIDVPQT